MPDPVFKAVIRDLKLILDDRAFFRGCMAVFPNGSEVEVIVRKPKERIVDPLRKYYFKVVAKMLADFTGHSKEKVHEMMKIKFASEKDPATGLLMVESVFSNESEMPVEDKEAFILEVRSWSSDYLELIIPERQRVDY